MTDHSHLIAVDQLVVGLYVHLDKGWTEHPFTFSSFKIRDDKQIDIIRKLGIETIRWDPARSDNSPAEPMSLESDSNSLAATPVASDDACIDDEMLVKLQRIEQLRVYRQQIERVEAEFVNASKASREVTKLVGQHPGQCLTRATELVGGMVESITSAPELALQLISGAHGNLSLYSHVLNVSILALVFAREMKLDSDDIFKVGLGAMLHDVGLSRVPGKVLYKRGDLTRAESSVRRQHAEFGIEIAKRMQVDSAVFDIIAQHHEYADGSGYPRGLTAEQGSELAQLVGIVNHYENLCNPLNQAGAMSPHEALSVMYARQRTLFRPDILQAFIRFMGVYPPGSIVSLSNASIGLVIKSYASNPLRPTLILYDEDTPSDQAIILDLREERDVNISKALNPANLPIAIFDYLSPQERINYYFDVQ